MKTFILFLSLFVSASLFAQNYEHFEVNDSGSIIFLRLKASDSPAPRKINPDMNARAFRTVNNVACMQKIVPIFQKHFAGLTGDELAALKPVEYVLQFDKDLKVWNFGMHFPKQSDPVVLKYEANCYHFGKELIGFDLSPYVIPATPELFAGSDYHFQLFMPMRFSSQRIVCKNNCQIFADLGSQSKNFFAERFVSERKWLTCTAKRPVNR